MRTLDILSGQISFFLKDGVHFSTKIGILLSCLVICCSIGAAIFFIQRFFSLDKPYLITSTVHQEALTFKNISNVPFAVRLSDQYGSPISRVGAFEISCLWINTTSNPNGGLMQHYYYQNTSSCDIKKHFPESTREVVQNFADISTFTCIDYDGSFDLLNFYGGKQNYTFVGFLFVQCNTSDSTKKCLPQSEIDDLLVNTYLEAALVDYTVASTEELAVFPKLNLYRTAVSNQSYLRVWLTLMHGEYTTDSGLIFENRNTIEYYTINVLKEQYKSLLKSQINQGLIEFAAITLQNSEYKTFYLRSYVKLQEAFANFGGIVKGLIIVAQIIYYILSRKDYWREVMKLLPLFTLSQGRVIENTGENTLKSNSLFPIKKVNMLKLSIEKDLELTLVERVAPFMCYKTKRLAFFEKNISVLKEIFSANHIIDLSHCVSKLKELSFPGNELHLFNLVKENKIKLDEIFSKEEKNLAYKERELISEIKLI